MTLQEVEKIIKEVIQKKLIVIVEYVREEDGANTWRP